MNFSVPKSIHLFLQQSENIYLAADLRSEKIQRKNAFLRMSSDEKPDEAEMAGLQAHQIAFEALKILNQKRLWVHSGTLKNPDAEAARIINGANYSNEFRYFYY